MTLLTWALLAGAVVLGVVGWPLAGVAVAIVAAALATAGLWKGMQQQGQGRTVASLGAVFGGIAVAVVLAGWKIFKLFR